MFIIREPVDKSVAHPGLCWDSLLAKMYDGKERFSAIFQVKAAEFQASVGEEIIRITDLVVNTGACPPLFIVERDPNSLNLFLQINQRTGRIDADEASVCREVIRRCNTWTPALAIHLTASHDICWARVTSRSRSAEDNINEDYLRELNKAHGIQLSTQRLVSLPICHQAEICTDKYTAEQVTAQVIKVRNGQLPRVIQTRNQGMRQTPNIRSCPHPTSNVAYFGLIQVLCGYFNRPNVSVWKKKSAQLTGPRAIGLVTPPPPSHGPIDETTCPPNKKRSIRAGDHVNTDADDAGFSGRATGIFDGNVSTSFKCAGVAPPAEANGKPVVSPALVPFFAYILLYHTRCSQLLATPAHGVGE